MTLDKNRRKWLSQRIAKTSELLKGLLNAMSSTKSTPEVSADDAMTRIEINDPDVRDKTYKAAYNKKYTAEMMKRTDKQAELE